MMTTTPRTVELGAAGTRRLPEPTEHQHGQIYHLSDEDAIVLPEHRLAGGWRCFVIASRRPVRDTAHLDVSDRRLAAAFTTMVFDPDNDPDGYTMLWLTCVWQVCRGGPRWLGANTLAYDIRAPGTLIVDLGLAAQRRLLEATRLRASGARNLLARMVELGQLGPVLPGLGDSWGIYQLQVSDDDVPVDGP